MNSTGAYHAIDLVATFGWPYMTLDDNELAFNHSQCNPAANITFTDRDRDFADFFLTLWTNFAKFKQVSKPLILLLHAFKLYLSST